MCPFSGLIETKQVEHVALGPWLKQFLGRQSRPWDCLGIRARSIRKLLNRGYRIFFVCLNFVLPLQMRGPSNDPSSSSKIVAVSCESVNSWNDQSLSASLGPGHCPFPTAGFPRQGGLILTGSPLPHLGSSTPSPPKKGSSVGSHLVNNPRPIRFFFFFLIFIYLFMAVLGLRFCARAFSSCGKRGPLFIAVRGPLTIAASLVAEHRFQTRRLSNCGSRA